MKSEKDALSPFEALYEASPDERAVFGNAWRGPDTFTRATGGHLVARYAAEEPEGSEAEVICFACPARFYAVRVFEKDSANGRRRPAFELGTGSGSAMAVLARDMAIAISQGMLAIKKL